MVKLGLVTVQDLLELLPIRAENHLDLTLIKNLPFNQEVVIEAEILRLSSRRSQRGALIIQATLEDASGKITALWFNQKYLLSYLKAGQRILLFGQKKIAPALGNPFFVKKIINQLEIAPIYPTTAGLSQAMIRKVLRQIRPQLKLLSDRLPEQLRSELKLAKRSDVLEKCHFDCSIEALEKARQTLAVEELLLLCLQSQIAKKERLATKSLPFKIDASAAKKIVEGLPFKLTNGQRKVTWQIIQDLEQPQPMNRLLYGEVGSGKTVVGLIIAGLLCQRGQQVLWLNPTTALANQQYQNALKLLGPLNVSVSLITGSTKQDPQAGLLIGTQALLNLTDKLETPGLVIIDEQHRFGVEQRQAIIKAFPQTNSLMMTATPIPRSLAQVLFNHLDISHLTDKPSYQQIVKTIVIDNDKRLIAECQIEERLKIGQGGYVICPLIDFETTPESLFEIERKTVIGEEQRLQKRFPQAKIGLIHGRLKEDQKNEILNQFKNGQVDILLSTSVVEVGIDNPQATWILIEDADYFGLSQLHQLRGRVGRGDQKSVCYLVRNSQSELAEKRLKFLEANQDGLKLAEYDLKLRGPGELFGFNQSGFPPLKYARSIDLSLLQAVSQSAKIVVEQGWAKYPELSRVWQDFVKNNEQLVA